MRRLTFLMSSAILLAGLMCLGAARADDVKPVAVVSLSGYENVMRDVELIGELSDNPHLGKVAKGLMVVATKGEGLLGLDKNRPWGVLIGTDGEHVGGGAFVPVSDLDKLMGIAKDWAGDKIKKHDDGTYEISGHKKPLYVQETHKGWAFIVDNRDFLPYMPENPAKHLAGLNVAYDVAARIYVGNIPPACREKLHAEMEKHFQKMVKRHRERCKRGSCPMNEEMAAHLCAHMNRVCGDIEHITLGWRLDNDLRQGVLELSVEAKKGSEVAKHLAKLGAMRTDFGGFELPEAAITGRVTTQCDAPPAEHLDKMIAKLRARVSEKIEKKVKSKEEAEAAKKIAGVFLDVMKKTVATGHNDAAVSISLDEESVAVIAGRFVADGRQLESAVKTAAEAIAKKHPECVEKILTLDAKRYMGVNLHVATIPVTDKCPRKEQAVEAVGENLQIVIGFGSKAVYLAAGRDAMRSLLIAIEDSQESRRWTVPPFEFTVNYEELLEFADEFGPCGPQTDAKRFHAMIDKAEDALEKAHGRDCLRVKALPSGRGIRLRLELDEGVLRVASTMKPHHRRHAKHGPKKCAKKDE